MRNASFTATCALCSIAIGMLAACSKNVPETAAVSAPPPAPVVPATPPPPPPPTADDLLAKALDGLGTVQSDRGKTLRLSSAHFRPGDTHFAPEDATRIDRVAAVLKEHPGTHVLIEGFSDSRGSDRVNERLAARRAEAVEHALTKRGVDASQLRSHGVGGQRPIGDNGTAEGREQNRRVEVVFSNAEGRFASAGDNVPAG